MYRVFCIPVGYLRVNCYLLSDPDSGDAYIIDPGDEPKRIADMAAEQGASVRGILITHAHFDHIGAAEALSDLYGCPVYVTAEEARSASEHPVYERMMKRFYQSFLRAFEKHGSPISEGDVLPLGKGRISVLSVPGHSVSGTCFYCAEEGLLFSGDTLFAGACGREDFYLDAYGGRSVLRENIARKLLVLPPETRVFPGHGEPTAVGAEQ